MSIHIAHGPPPDPPGGVGTDTPRVLRSVNPATGEPMEEYPCHHPDEIRAILESVDEAQRVWSKTPHALRRTALEKLGTALRNRREELVHLMALEMGKPVTAGHAEIAKCAWLCDHYAEHAASMLAPQIVDADVRRSYISFEPLGVILAVMPWNFPFWQALRCAVPALAAGNGIVLKHATNVPGCALALETLFEAIGLPKDLFRTVLSGRGRVPDMVKHPAVAAVTVTGSVEAGRAVARLAGDALKKCVLELGGSDPYIVLEDADVDVAARQCVHSRMTNGGQSCIAAKRFVVIESIRDEFESRVLELMSAVTMGDPLDDVVELGPLARLDLRDRLASQVRRSVAQGATLRCGGEVPGRRGAWYPPTVLTGVLPGSPVFDEETFGPCAAIVGAEDENHAVWIANDTRYGLGAAIFTGDPERGETLSRRLRSGMCFVNEPVRSDPRLPFGGIKASGYGRELGSIGTREMTNPKAVVVS